MVESINPLADLAFPRKRLDFSHSLHLPVSTRKHRNRASKLALKSLLQQIRAR